MDKFIRFAVDKPKLVTAIMLVLTIGIGLFAALPSIAPEKFPMLNGVKVDTDPENMLPGDEPVRVFHDDMKKEFNLYDMIVVGVINEKNPEGVFNVESLSRISKLAEFAKTLNWQEEKDGKTVTSGVISTELMALSTVDNIEPGGPGVVRFEWLMPTPPATEKEALAIRKKAERIPMFNGTLVSDGDRNPDGSKSPAKAVALYVPISDKHLSYKIASQLQEKIDSFPESNDEFHITGLPVAEDTFGVEMFKQMAISAPLAMLVIFLLMWYFFHKLSLIISPMIVAVICIIQTMGLLVITGNTIHIMSSMIPIFIMPIAVLDAIHILSEFFDRYQQTKDRRKTIIAVMKTLFSPMLFTSLTTAVGFASLALTPIPPVQVFGIFIAFGVVMAWVWTIIFIPASVMFIKQESLENFGHKEGDDENKSRLAKVLYMFGRATYARAKLVLVVFLLIAVSAVYGISKININDNPIRWFEKEHRIRIADKKLNEHFAGTYMAYLTFAAKEDASSSENAFDSLKGSVPDTIKKLTGEGFSGVEPVFNALMSKADSLRKEITEKDKFLDELNNYASKMADGKSTPEGQIDAWYEAATFVLLEKQRSEIFKDPEMLEWISNLQDYILTIKNKEGSNLVGKSSSLSDVVRTVYRELLGGGQENYLIPKNRQGVAQTLMQYQNGHRPNDLWHFVQKPDEQKGKSGFRRVSLWIQLKSGDNKDMTEVVRGIDSWIAANPAPEKIKHDWFGLTYINVIWQDKMVAGMLNAFLGSFVVVLIMMVFLFRSILWGILSMIPLTVTIGAIYGFIGFVGKDYDMPVAVLSSLSLGLAVDYAIHFLARSRELRKSSSDWKAASELVFGEPARAITRNVLVVGVGFLPLLAAPLVPYKTVGFFIAAILVTAGVASLFILPACIRLLEKYLFKKETKG